MHQLVKFLAAPLMAVIPLLLLADTGKTISTGKAIGRIAVIKLPKPDSKGTVPLEATLQKRRSIRSYLDSSISLQAVSQLLWAAQGITDRNLFRTAPSAGALYPLEIYVVAANVHGLGHGIYRYQPESHSLVFTVDGNFSQELARAALQQDCVNHAPAVFVISGVPERTTGKYGKRGIRYMYMESGHAAQNLCLQAVALDLSSVTIGAFIDQEVSRVLKIDQDQIPLYIIPVGRAKN